MESKPHLKIDSNWVPLEVIGEPSVVLTYKGYAPVLEVRNRNDGREWILYISAKSLSSALEPVRLENDGHFTGLRFSLRKESDDRYAAYELRVDNNYSREADLLKASRH